MPDCYDPVQFLKTEIGRFSQILPRKVIPMSPLLGMLPKGVYPVSRGRQQKLIRYLPSRPVKTVSDYSPMFSAWPAPYNGQCASTAGACTPTMKQLGAISEEVTWEPKWLGWKSPKFCHNELITTYDVAEQLSNVFSVITDNVKQDIEMEYYLDLVDLAENTVIPTGSEGDAITANIFNNGDAPDVDPTCPLTLGVLEYAVQNGWRRGYYGSASAQSLFGMRNGRPNSLLITSAETAANIVQTDVRARSVDGYRVNMDIQTMFQPAGSSFLSKYGIRSYNGFNFLEIAFPRRGTFSNGTFTPVADQIPDPAVPEDCETIAPDRVATLVNPDWESFETAPVEEAILLLRNDIFEIQSWPVVRNPGGGIRFQDVTNFLGEWELVDWRDCQENPHGLFSYAQALHAYAPKPLSTYGAYKIYFQRCPITGSCGPCS